MTGGKKIQAKGTFLRNGENGENGINREQSQGNINVRGTTEEQRTPNNTSRV
jgi:hypothetical protein